MVGGGGVLEVGLGLVLGVTHPHAEAVVGLADPDQRIVALVFPLEQFAEERFERNQKQRELELEQQRGAARDEGFEKELRIVSKLSPKLAKEHIVRKWKQSPDDAVRMLNALPESASKRTLGQMKTPEEIQITHELLERLSKEDVEQFEP